MPSKAKTAKPISEASGDSFTTETNSTQKKQSTSLSKAETTKKAVRKRQKSADADITIHETVTDKTNDRPAKRRSRTSTKRKKHAKFFVLDTNVLLHDPSALWRFEENDLAIPITVIEEVEKFKRGSDIINFHAREIARSLDELAAKGGLTQENGVPLGENLGKLRVVVSDPHHPKVHSQFFQDLPDHRILSAAIRLQEELQSREVVLVSKDVSLRLKARSLGMVAEDYENDKIADFDKLYKGKYFIEGLDDSLFSLLFSPPYLLPIHELNLENTYPNAYFILRGQNKSALARFDAEQNGLVRVEKRTAFGVYPRNAEQTFALDALTNNEIQLVTLSGKAGTGKTLLALAGALESRRKYHQIFLARPIIPLANREIGFLPGDVHEKIDPYMQPLWDNLGVIRGHFSQNSQETEQIQNMLDNEKLTISPLAFIRGRSLNKIFFIVDEAQNLTGHEVKTIITRAGEGTKIVLTGDPHQIDSPYLDARSNGLTRLIDKMRGQGLYAHITLEKGERSELAEIASDIL